MKHTPATAFVPSSVVPLARAPETKDDNVTITEMKEAVDTFIATFGDAHKEMKAEIEELAKKANRGALGGGAPAGVDNPNGPQLFGKGDIVAERKALSGYVRSGEDAELKSISLAVASDPGGGYLVLPAMSDTMSKRLFDLSPMRRLARIVTVNIGDAFEEPDDREEAEAIWAEERQARPDTDAAQLGLNRIPLHEIYAMPKVTQRLLDDSAFNVGGWVEGKITDRFSRAEGTAFTSGDGVKRPRGFATYATAATADFTRPRGTLQHLVTGNASGFVARSGDVNPADVLRDLVWKLRAPYRKGAVWLMSSNTASLIDKFKNGTGDYIWRDGNTAGAPPSLLGYPVEFDEGMPDVAAGALPIAFGNFQIGYTIVDRPGLKMLRDPYTDKPHVKFYAYKRVGGGVVNDDAIKVLKVSA